MVPDSDPEDSEDDELFEAEYAPAAPVRTPPRRPGTPTCPERPTKPTGPDARAEMRRLMLAACTCPPGYAQEAPLTHIKDRFMPTKHAFYRANIHLGDCDSCRYRAASLYYWSMLTEEAVALDPQATSCNVILCARAPTRTTAGPMCPVPGDATTPTGTSSAARR